MLDCLQCGQEFTRKASLKRHATSKHAGVQHECSKCHDTFSRLDVLARHMRRHLVTASSTICPICLNIFSRKDYLKQHQRTCRGKRRLPRRSRDPSVGISSTVLTPSNDFALEPLSQSWWDSIGPLWTIDEEQEEGNYFSQSMQGLDVLGSGGHEVWQLTETLQSSESFAFEQLPVSTSDALVANGMHMDVDEYARLGCVQYDNLGRVDIEQWPSDDEPAPAPPPFIEALVETLQEPVDMKVEAIMRPCMINLDTQLSTLTIAEPGDRAPQGFKFQYVPVIGCLDCICAVYFVRPDSDLVPLRNHLRDAEHVRRVRLRLIAESETAQEVLNVITSEDGEYAGKTLADLVDLSMSEINDSYFSSCGQNLLILAVRNGDIDCLRYLLDEGLDVRETDSKGRTAMHWACSLGRVDLGKLLISKGAGLFDDPSETHDSPIDLAVAGNQFDAAIQLLVFAAGVRSTRASVTALELASRSGHAGILTIMLDQGADPNKRGSRYPLEAALRWGTCPAIQVLLEAGAAPSLISQCYLDGLKWKRDGSHDRHEFQYRDAAEKMILLERYGFDWKRFNETIDLTCE